MLPHKRTTCWHENKKLLWTVFLRNTPRSEQPCRCSNCQLPRKTRLCSSLLNWLEIWVECFDPTNFDFVIRESRFFLLDNSKKAGSCVSSSAVGFMSSLQKMVLNIYIYILKKGKVPWQIGVELLCPLKFHSDLRWRDTAIVTT